MNLLLLRKNALFLPENGIYEAFYERVDVRLLSPPEFEDDQEPADNGACDKQEEKSANCGVRT